MADETKQTAEQPKDVKCKYFGACGGCTIQHIPHELQLKNKITSAASMLDIPGDSIKVFSGKDFNYRNRMDFIFHPGGIGFRQRDKWYKIVDIDECPISNERLNSLLAETRDFFKGVESFDIHKLNGTYRYAVIRTPGISSTISFILNEDSSKSSAAVDKIREFAGSTSADNVVVGYVPKNTDNSITENFFVVKGTEYLKENFLGKEFEYHSQGFFQNNSEMAEEMIGYVKSLFQKNDGELLDLYGGVGVFGISMAELFKRVTIVESYEMSIKCAERNIKSNNLANCFSHVLDAKSINKLTFRNKLSVITDPPRSGMIPKAIQRLLELSPDKIVYISCNPQQLSKEINQFTKAGYKIASCALFDLFPQTNHFEIVVELTL